MPKLKCVTIFLGYLFLLVFPGYSDTKQLIQIQSYLNALGYNVGHVDGIIGTNSRKKLIKALEENGYKFDGRADGNEALILERIAKDKNVHLRERLSSTSYKNLLQIMDEQTAELFVPSN